MAARFQEERRQRARADAAWAARSAPRVHPAAAGVAATEIPADEVDMA